MVTEYILGPMAGGTKDNGLMENNMVKEPTYYKMAVEDMENGSKVRELDGLTRITPILLMTLNEKYINFEL